MKAFLEKLRARLGDFWWYTLMIFLACRAADALNMFVGLWLVPRCVDMKELGAVQPLTSFASFLAIPASVLAITFLKEVNRLATRREFGKMKSLIRGVFIATGVFLALAFVAAKLLLPVFLRRIRIEEGSLGLLILASAFIGAVAPVYTNALQALKRFGSISVLQILGAPIRLVTMIVAMPFRPLSGYFLGQAATPAFSIVAAMVMLRKDFAVAAETYWTKPIVRRLALVFLGMAGYQLAGSVVGLLEMTVLRENLPDVESGAYYMVTRFSDISAYVTCALITVLFPMTAETAEKGGDTRPLVFKASLAQIAAGAILALAFVFAGKPLLALLPGGANYSAYAWAIPAMIGVNTVSAIQTFHFNTEASAGRFSFLYLYIPLHLAFAAALAFVKIDSLGGMVVWFAVTNLARLAFALPGLFKRK